MARNDVPTLLHENVQNEFLRLHMLAVEAVLHAFAMSLAKMSKSGPDGSVRLSEYSQERRLSQVSIVSIGYDDL